MVMFMAAAPSAPSAPAGSAASTPARVTMSAEEKKRAQALMNSFMSQPFTGLIDPDVERDVFPVKFDQQISQFEQGIEKILQLSDQVKARAELEDCYNSIMGKHVCAFNYLLQAKCKRALASLVETSSKEKFVIEAYSCLESAFLAVSEGRKGLLLKAILAESSLLLQVMVSVAPDKIETVKGAARRYQKAAEEYIKQQESLSSSGSRNPENGWFRNAIYLALGWVAVMASVKFAMYCLQSRNKAL